VDSKKKISHNNSSLGLPHAHSLSVCLFLCVCVVCVCFHFYLSFYLCCANCVFCVRFYIRDWLANAICEGWRTYNLSSRHCPNKVVWPHAVDKHMEHGRLHNIHRIHCILCHLVSLRACAMCVSVRVYKDTVRRKSELWNVTVILCQNDAPTHVN